MRCGRITIVFAVFALFGQLWGQSNQPAPWSATTERTVGGPEADLVVRTGDINKSRLWLAARL